MTVAFMKRFLLGFYTTSMLRGSPCPQKIQPACDNRNRRGSRIAGLAPEIADAYIFYEQNYTPISFYELRRGEQKTYIGSRAHPRTCRFCGKAEPNVRFSEDAHAVSHMVGNRTLFLAEECDECNSKSSAFESDFGKFTHPDRTWGQVPGKKGVPTLKSFAKTSRVDVSSNGFVIQQKQGDELIDFDPDKNESSFLAKATIHKYRPLGVYKALLKMALSILDAKHLTYLRPALKWIATNGLQEGAVNDITGYKCITSFTSGPAPYPFPTVLIMRRKHDLLNCPYMTFVLLFHNYTYQIFLPCPSKDRHLHGMKANISMWPHPFMLRPRGHFRTNRTMSISLASPESVEHQERHIKFRFAGFKRNPLNAQH